MAVFLTRCHKDLQELFLRITNSKLKPFLENTVITDFNLQMRLNLGLFVNTHIYKQGALLKDFLNLNNLQQFSTSVEVIRQIFSNEIRPSVIYRKF